MIKKSFCIILCILVVGMVFMPATSTYSAAIVTTGITGVVCALLSYYGISFASVGLTTSDIDGGIYDLLVEYAAYVGASISTLFPASNVVRGAASLISIGGTFLDSFFEFVTWLVYRNVSAGGTAGSISEGIRIVESTQIDGYPVMLYPGERYQWAANSDSPWIEITGNSSPVYIWWAISRVNSNWGTVQVYSVSSYSWAFHYWASNGSDYLTGQSTSGAYGYYNQLGNVWADRIMPKDGLYINNGFFAYDIAAAAPTISQGGTGLRITGTPAIPQVLPTDVTLGVTGLTSSDDTVDAAGEYVLSAVSSNVLSTTTINTAIPDGPFVSRGLESVFPFCIPWDLYHMYQSLDAQPVAPSFSWLISIDRLGISETISVDFSDWDDVAAVCRKMELLGFCVGLILVTRKLIRG